MKGRILQLNTSIPLKCGTGCLFIKHKLGELARADFCILGRIGFGPSCPAPNVSSTFSQVQASI